MNKQRPSARLVLLLTTWLSSVCVAVFLPQVFTPQVSDEQTGLAGSHPYEGLKLLVSCQQFLVQFDGFQLAAAELSIRLLHVVNALA